MQDENVSRALYDAMRMALKDIEAVLARHGCPAGATMTDWIDEQLTALAATAKPIDMLLLCPACGMQHIDAVETGTTLSRSGLDTLTETEVVTWSNPPHRSHMCHGCGHQWRPADVATNGVRSIKTKGKNDSPAPEAAQTLSEDEWLALAERHVKADWNSEVPDGYLYAVKGLVLDAFTRASAASVAEPSKTATQGDANMPQRGTLAWLIRLLQQLQAHGTASEAKVFINDPTFGRVEVGGALYGIADVELTPNDDDEEAATHPATNDGVEAELALLHSYQQLAEEYGFESVDSALLVAREAAQQQAEPSKFSVSREWLAERLERADDADCAAGQSQSKRPCDIPPGCNGNNCLGCGEQQAEPVGGERAAFEEWAHDEWPNSNPPHSAWIGWQARAAHSGQRVGERECRHCGWLCRPNDAPAKKWHPLEQNGQRAGDEAEALRDMLDDARAELDMLRAELGVPVEPHQSLTERMLSAAKKASRQSPAPEGLRGFSPRGDFAVELRFHSCRLAQAYLHDIAAQIANNVPQESAR